MQIQLLTRDKIGVATNKAGFSLIEVMVAMVIFVIGVLGAYILQIQSTEGNALANRVSTSASWATYAIEEMIGQDYDNFVDTKAPNGMAGLDEIDNTADGAIYILPSGDEELDLSKLFPGDADNPAHPQYDAAYNPPANPLYSVFWNVAEGEGPGGETGVLRDVKHIRFHVVRHGGIGSGNLYSHDYYKAKWPESDH